MILLCLDSYLIHDHIGHYLDHSPKTSRQTKRAAVKELREITKYL
jgi:hypothetical protein